MDKTKVVPALVAPALLVVGLAAFTSTPRRPAPNMGCDITIQAHNNASANVTINLEDSEVKIKNGLWSKLKQGGSWVVNPGGSQESKVVSLDLGCDFNRQYKFLMKSGGNDKYIYFPSGNDFTDNKTLMLADVGRHFK